MCIQDSIHPMIIVPLGHKLTKNGIVLAQVLCRHKIKVFGTMDDPLFMMAHVALKIGDANHSRSALILENNDGCIVRKDCDGVHPTPILLTERGVYMYIIKSTRPETELFVNWAMNILTGAEVRSPDRKAHVFAMVDKLNECAR